MTRFPDGSETGAFPHPDKPHYYIISHRCGYGDDVLAYCREHEFAHALVCEHFLDQPSHVLWNQARGLKIERGRGMFEKMAAQTLQRWLRANERPILARCDWDALKRAALDLLAGEETT